jgi:hypothetical protein
MAATIRGTIKPDGGQGWARINYPVMIAAAAADCPAIANCGKYGSINVEQLDGCLSKSHADCWTKQITWVPPAGDIAGTQRPETFGFIKIRFECPIGGATYDAWIILPEGQGYSHRDGVGVEIIADVFIPGVKPGEPCAIHIDHVPLMKRPDWFGKIYGFPPYEPAPGAREWLEEMNRKT